MLCSTGMATHCKTKPERRRYEATQRLIDAYPNSTWRREAEALLVVLTAARQRCPQPGQLRDQNTGAPELVPGDQDRAITFLLPKS
jgi:hypothetical protein